MRKIILSLCVLTVSLCADAQESRHFIFHYAFTVNSTAGKKVRIWIPAAQSDAFQDVKVISANGDLPLKTTRESKYRDEIYFAEGNARKPELHFDIEYDVVRHERRALTPSPHLVRTTLTTMRYEKTGTGWGRGDVLYACDAKKGNCTDFHSLFIAMARSQGIPARFEIGFPLPEDKHSGEIAGYHCWSDFYVDGKGWIPVDISEAWKHPDRRDYFFGSHDVNRVQFSMGRDLRLNPPQDSKPLNYFVYPYVEADAKEYANVSLAFSFADVPDEKAGK
jgi:hypothetical protein